MSRVVLFLEEHPFMSALVLASAIFAAVVLTSDRESTVIKVTPVTVNGKLILKVEGAKNE